MINGRCATYVTIRKTYSITSASYSLKAVMRSIINVGKVLSVLTVGISNQLVVLVQEEDGLASVVCCASSHHRHAAIFKV